MNNVSKKDFLTAEKQCSELKKDYSSLKRDIDFDKGCLKSTKRTKNLFIAGGIFSGIFTGAGLATGIMMLKDGNLFGLIPVAIGAIFSLFTFSSVKRTAVEGGNVRYFEDRVCKKEYDLNKLSVRIREADETLTSVTHAMATQLEENTQG